MFLKEDPIGFEGGLNVSLYVGGNPVVGINPSGLACTLTVCRNIGETIFNAVPQVDSEVERELVNHYFHGNGTDFFLSRSQTSGLSASPEPNRDPEFDFGIGRLNPEPTSGRIDLYDFDTQIGQRGIIKEVATRVANVVGSALGGAAF